MSYAVCPAAVIHAPVERVWALLADPAAYSRWADVTVVSVQPKGPVQAGQRIEARASEPGRHGVRIVFLIEEVDEARHALLLHTHFSFGLQVHNHIQCDVLSEGACRVQFG